MLINKEIYIIIVKIFSYETPIDTIQQIISKNISWGGFTETFAYSIKSTTKKEFINLMKLFKVMTTDELLRHISTSDYCYGIEELQYGIQFIYN